MAKKDHSPKPGESVVITNGQRKVIKHTAPVENKNTDHEKNKPKEGQGDNN